MRSIPCLTPPNGNFIASIFERPVVQHPIVDYQEFSTERSPSLSCLHLSKYLHTVRPIVLVTMSIMVLELFHDNVLVDYRNTDNADFL
jgi:hypothetical protein